MQRVVAATRHQSALARSYQFTRSSVLGRNSQQQQQQQSSSSSPLLLVCSSSRRTVGSTPVHAEEQWKSDVQQQQQQQHSGPSGNTASVFQSLVDRVAHGGAAPSRKVPLTHSLFESAYVPEAAIATSNEYTISKANNGVTVASVQGHHFLTSLALSTNVGSRHENVAYGGFTAFMEHLAFASTTNHTDFRQVRDMSASAIARSCQVSQEFAVHRASCLPAFADQAMLSIADTVQNPAFHEWEVDEARERYAQRIQETEQDPQAKIYNLVHEAAFKPGDGSLANSVLAKEASLPFFSTELCREHVKTMYRPELMVVAAVNYPGGHERLVELVDYAFDNLQAPVEANDTDGQNWLASYTQPAEYQGGTVMHHAPASDGLEHMAIAFKGPSWQNQKDLCAVVVLTNLLGGGGSFSAGGPGKGMHSRLYQNVLGHNFVQNASGVMVLYKDIGLVGVYASCVPGALEDTFALVKRELKDLANKPVSDVELGRAKNSSKSLIEAGGSSSMVIVDDLWMQVQQWGKVQSTAESLAALESVTAADLQRVAKQMMQETPSIAVLGETGPVKLEL